MPTTPEKVKRCGWETLNIIMVSGDSYIDLTRAADNPQSLTYNLIAAHPGCTHEDITGLKRFTSQKLQMNPEQTQIFTPPSYTHILH